MKEMPLVSVIVPVYNGEEYIESCLGKLLSQTYKNLEIIVVDDGSLDRSVAIAKGYPVKVICQSNKGVSAARNTGMDCAKGEYIHFMDVDDLVNDVFYQNLVSSIEEARVDIACCEMINQRVSKQSGNFKKPTVYRSVSEKLKITYVGRIGYVWRYLFRTDFLRANKLRFEEGRIVEDLMFSLAAVFFADGLIVVPGAKYTYVHRKNSQLTTVDEQLQAKRDEDWQYARTQRKAFAQKYGFKIPGVNSGKLAYRWWEAVNYWKNRKR